MYRRHVQATCLPPNFEDEELSVDQPVDEVVNINQQVSMDQRVDELMDINQTVSMEHEVVNINQQVSMVHG